MLDKIGQHVFYSEDEAYEYWHDEIYSYDPETWICKEYYVDPHDIFKDWYEDGICTGDIILLKG